MDFNNQKEKQEEQERVRKFLFGDDKKVDEQKKKQEEIERARRFLSGEDQKDKDETARDNDRASQAKRDAQIAAETLRILAASKKREQEPKFSWDAFWAQCGSKGNKNSNGNGDSTYPETMVDMWGNPTGSINKEGSILNIWGNPTQQIRFGTVYSLGGYPIGYIDPDGTIRNLSNYRVGEIKTDGRRYDLWGNPTNKSIEELMNSKID